MNCENCGNPFEAHIGILDAETHIVPLCPTVVFAGSEHPAEPITERIRRERDAYRQLANEAINQIRNGSRPLPERGPSGGGSVGSEGWYRALGELEDRLAELEGAK